MSRALVITLLALSALAACGTQPPAEVVDRSDTEFIAYTQMQDWLNLQEEVSNMTEEQLAGELERAGSPGDSRELYYFGLLNQHQKNYDGWTIARDSFRQLGQDSTLSDSQRQLAGILERYNQKMINWYQQHGNLLKEHAELQEQLRIAEQKIQAITELETSISTRREQ